MKFPIAWHEECLKNMAESYERDVAALKRQQSYVEERRLAVTAYRFQIAQAKADKKDGFDREKYLKPKPSRGAADHSHKETP